MRWRDLPAVMVLLAVLVGCAPAVTRGSGELRAAFSNLGVIWAREGAAFIALAPSFRPQQVSPSGTVAVAWSGNDAWTASTSGLVRRVTGRPDVVNAGRVAQLSSTRIYREDGSALTFTGEPVAGLVGPPNAVTTGGDGRDYALQGARLFRLDSERTLLTSSARGPHLLATADGATAVPFPSAATRDAVYRLVNGRLERLDPAGALLASVPHAGGLVGIVAEFVVTVSPEGVLRVFRYDLSEVSP